MGAILFELFRKFVIASIALTVVATILSKLDVTDSLNYPTMMMAFTVFGIAILIHVARYLAYLFGAGERACRAGWHRLDGLLSVFYYFAFWGMGIKARCLDCEREVPLGQQEPEA